MWIGARKVEDKSDEEKSKYEETTIEYHYQRVDTDNSIIYLLSIGVYPFSQKHFEDETVIDIKTLTEEQK